ncbi:uncharacterized protein LOC8262560 isoform X3 [Ricinus communis]|uniref:uncharacterized protein LOC8262560 isoform X3 n=1 Tax=Ricinus communis TaxID=3988 RepID=UPI00201A7D7E|nr:uncharacterized protein LOC8262560 isoform X3 [Ricinus communis]
MRFLDQILGQELVNPLFCPNLRYRQASLMNMRSSLLVQKFKLYIVKMGSGMMQRLRGILQMDILFPMMSGGIRKSGWYFPDSWLSQVDPANVRLIEFNALLEAEKVAEATKQAIKRKIAQAASVDFQSRSLPAKLRINPDDTEEVKAAKRKKIHSFKSKMRFEQLEVVQNKRQNAWQQFQTTKGSSKKIGFFSGRKRESIFKSPDDPNGKVGVTGSGKGLTEFQRREKHLHLKGGVAETDD